MNNHNFKNHVFQNLKIIAVAILLAVGTQYAFAVDWQNPAGPPPGNNTAAPINVGNAGQIKTGGVTLGLGLENVPNGLGLNVPFGKVKFKLGATNPAGKFLKASDADGTLEWATVSGGGSSSNTVSYVSNPSGTNRDADVLTSVPQGTFNSIPAPSVLAVSCPDDQVLTGLYLQQGNPGIRYEVVGVKCAALQTP